MKVDARLAQGQDQRSRSMPSSRSFLMECRDELTFF